MQIRSKGELMIRGINSCGIATDEAPAAAEEEPRPSTPATPIILRQPTGNDGAALHRLVAACPPLDPNSLYCNLLQCTHFASTGIAAERAGELVGFISGYIPPAQPDTLFVWQVAVAASTRGEGLAKRMLRELLQRPATAGVRYLETTITPGNAASWALFESLARDLQAPAERQLHFERARHFGGAHDDELLMRIGPLKSPLADDTQAPEARGSPLT